MATKKKISGTEKSGVTNTPNVISINDPINTDSWKCVVVMAVEKSSFDSFVLKHFMEEAANGCRSEIKVISFQDLILNILNDFTMGELPFKYAFLLNFSSIFKDAAEYPKNKLEIPLQLLVKIVKALLFYLREENLQRTDRKASGPLNPIKTMSERPTNVGNFDSSKTKINFGKKKEITTSKSKQTNISPLIEGGLKIRPPSVGKLNTKLLKRGETYRQDQWIDDAPSNGLFNLYILLTGFYNPKFPLELIKANIPLHSILCIDSSSLVLRRDLSTVQYKYTKQGTDVKYSKIEKFWNDFLNIVWNPSYSAYFKEVIFYIFEPRAIICDKKNLKDFIYKEISFLMYDLTDYKKQHLIYLSRLKLWDVKEEPNGEIMKKYTTKLDGFPVECLTVSVILNYIIDIIEGNEKIDFGHYDGLSNDSIDLGSSKPSFFEPSYSDSILPKIGPSNLIPAWSTIIREKDNVNLVKVYFKIKTLDEKYNLDGKNRYELSSIENSSEKSKSVTSLCISRNQILPENYKNGLFYSFWKKLKNNFTENKPFSVTLDFCLYSYLMTKIVCSYYPESLRSTSFLKDCVASNLLSNKISSYKLIENIKDEMYKPKFTVTQGTRFVLKCFPHNIKEHSKDFFCPSNYKIVTPEAIRVRSAPEFRTSRQSKYNVLYLSNFIVPDKLIKEKDWDVFQNLEQFLESSMFINTNGFEFVEELSQQKLQIKELQNLDEYNCIDHMYLTLTDSILITLHNRKNDNGIYLETFSNALKTKIGLRDFFEYILQDEIDLFKHEAKLQDQAIFSEGNNLIANENFFHCSDSNFWSQNSIKFAEHLRSKSILKRDSNGDSSKKFENKKKPETSFNEKLIGNSKELNGSVAQENETEFYQIEGYDIEDTATQFSGLKTTYYATECILSLELIEKLYGNQTLGVHIRQGGHTLHLFSYVCPTPHLPQPYACHLICNNGIILAFGERFTENFEYSNLKKSSQESENSFNRINDTLPHFFAEEKSQESLVNSIESDDTMFDLMLSTPNGLILETIRKVGRPFYIKQHHLFKTYSKYTNNEMCRLFLPNKSLIKIMKNGAVEILKTDTSLVFASITDLTTRSNSSQSLFDKTKSHENNEDKNSLAFTNYHFINSTGQAFTIENGKIKNSEKFQTFQFTNLESKQIFFRRKDNTSYIINGNGELCVQFQDGTKMRSSPFAEEKVNLGSRDDDSQNDTDFFLSDFVVIHEEVTFEHPSFATVVYSTLTKKWKILLPSNLSVTIEGEGNYFAEIDKQTNLTVKDKIIEIKRLSPNEELLCTATADLSVFEKQTEKNVYCKVEDLSGKSFVVESNSNYHVVENKKSLKELKKSERLPLLFEKILKGPEEQQQGLFPRGTKLSRENKYFVIRNDMTGLEIIHKEDCTKILTDLSDEDVIFTKKIAREEKLRCFILIRPTNKKKENQFKWKMNSILPNPKSSPAGETRSFSSTYGDPPSWMHPFPKKKVKFKLPENFTCRVFIETKKTKFFPQMASRKLKFYNLDDAFNAETDKIELEIDKMQDCLKIIAGENQDLLRKMYISVVRKLQETRKTVTPIMLEKLKRYQAMSKWYLSMQEYHKNCLRNHLIPGYFHHPVGMSALILYDLIMNLRSTKLTGRQLISSKLVFPSSPNSKSLYSNEEIEYNLSWCSEKSFSDLSYKSNLSVKSAPLILNKTNICSREVFFLKKAVSAPIFNIYEKISQPENIKEVTPEILCEFRESEVDFLIRANIKPPREEEHFMTLEDVFHMGLI